MAQKNVSTAVLSGKVTPGWIKRGVWLSQAALRFGNPGFVNKARAAAERFAKLRDGETTEMFEEASSLPSGAARNRKLLNALHGDQKQAWLDYYLNRDNAERELWFDLAWEGRFRAFGANETPDKEPEWIPVQAWRWLHPDPVKKDVVRGEGMVYWYVQVVDPRFYSDPPRTPSVLGPGRKKPIGVSYREQDTPLAEEMHRLLTAEPRRATGLYDAALAVSGKAAGAGSTESKAKRLMQRYTQWRSECSETERS
jgi:hypothetical protein